LGENDLEGYLSCFKMRFSIEYLRVMTITPQMGNICCEFPCERSYISVNLNISVSIAFVEIFRSEGGVRVQMPSIYQRRHTLIA